MITVNIAGRIVGEGNPVIISAEIGLNHNGDMELAKKMIQAAADCGCDAVKVQNYRTGDFVLNRHDLYDNGHGWVENKWEMCMRHELDFSQLTMLKEEADRVGVIFHSTPTNSKGVSDLVQLGVEVFKNGSDFLDDIHLLVRMACTALPVLLSTGSDGTGIASRTTIELALESLYEVWPINYHPVILLHCVREYPPTNNYVHRIDMLRKWFQVPVGYSDHTLGIDSAVKAVNEYGACWVEKHFTLDKTLPGPDHWFSATPAEMAALVKAVK